MAFVPVSQLPFGGAVTGTESVPAVQGLSTVRLTTRDIARSGTTAGLATLVAGTVTVASTAVTSTSAILLTGQANTVTGALRVSARVPGVSFTITSAVGGDAGSVAWNMYN